MSSFQPPPTWALPILVDERTSLAVFNPVWLKWFVDLTAALPASGAGSVSSVSVVSANGLAGTVATATTTPAITLRTTITGLLKGNGTAISAAVSGTDYAPATSGTSILYGNGAGGFSNVTIGTGVAFAAGTLSATGSGGTVTSVAALTLGTSGTDLSSTVANGTTTPVITLQVPTASASNRGALSAADWTTFNNKGSGTVTSVTGTAPVVSSGGTTPAISMAAATTSVNGYLTSTDWTTFNNKQPAGSYLVNGGALGTPSSGTVTNLTGTASININGTVGATTPAAGAFTTGSFSSTLGVTGATTLGGNVGIGGASVSNALDVNGSIRVQGGNRSLKFNNASVEINIAQVAGGSAALDFNSCALTNVGTIASGALTVTGTLAASGDAGIGTTTTPAGSSAASRFVAVAGSGDGVVQLTRTSATTGGGAVASAAGPGLIFYTHTGTVGSETYTDRMRITSDGRMRFISSSSYNGQQDARIQWVNENSAGVMGQISCVREASPAAPGALAFYTSPDVDVYGYTPFERMRISSAGIVTMGVYGAGAATFSAAGVISSVSDETWKTKDGIPTDPDAMLQKLAPGYWYYNDEKKETFGADRQLGFYAQNVNAAIGSEAAPEPEEGKPWGYYDRSVLAVTVMSLQKALLAIEQLTAKVAALENQLRVST